ncbi:kelch repeat and BTB domain-containing protein 12 [Elysia marginata]|uniref:Kelch repeat and BTB domain-containing protein 12 n=1 Tax=Elysia marginata TaxID=1093978 RepID=A0AAV4EWH2_9GAST|nr:kelch repeat and BTB domain-containing protein 12 [Elysia marginata]
MWYAGLAVNTVSYLSSRPALWPSGKTLAQRSGGVGSIPGRVKPRTLKLVLAADPPSVWHYGFSAKSGRPGVRIFQFTCKDPKQTLPQSKDRYHAPDFSVFVGQREFKCHRAILNNKAGYFRSLFSSGMKEVIEGGLSLQGVSGDIFADVLHWMYHEDFCLSNQNVFEVIWAADMLGIEDLLSECKQFVSHMSLDFENCISVYKISQHFEYGDLLSRSRTYVLKNFDAVCASEAFYDLNYDDVKSLVADSNLVSSSEDAVVECILRWFHHNDKLGFEDWRDKSGDEGFKDSGACTAMMSKDKGGSAFAGRHDYSATKMVSRAQTSACTSLDDENYCKQSKNQRHRVKSLAILFMSKISQAKYSFRPNKQKHPYANKTRSSSELDPILMQA